MGEGPVRIEQERDLLTHEIECSIRFQRRWQLISATSYVVSTLLILVSSTAATILAARGSTSQAAVLSAVATVLIGIEKSLLFREKWKFHLIIRNRLAILRQRFIHDLIDYRTAVQDFASITTDYAERSPLAGSSGETT